ncbi:MAG: hypothetical protein VXZ35_08030, partial [Pseudomonadota bacterium]|nr:hypothetical protein [Pseudomonadota bacterium]
QYFTELDFSVAQSARFSDRNQTLLGARYCSIKGITAAQIRYDNPEGNPITLYEVGYDPGTFGQLPALEDNEPPMQITTQGVKVSLWTESGLLMAEVSDIN